MSSMPAPRGDRVADGDKPRKVSAFQRRQAAIRSLRRRRSLVQAVIAAVILVAAVRHHLEQETPSVDALCPFGGAETLLTWLTTGHLISKTHPSNLVLALGLVVATLLAGNAFCGWLCPFGAVQDALTWLRRRLGLPTVAVPAKLDRILRYGRFAVLALILYMSVTTANLWFAGFDPYVTLFSLQWLFEPNPATMWPAWVVTFAVLGGSVLIERAWCRYLCPLGGVLSVLQHFSILRVRVGKTCTSCDLCVKPCPVGIDVSKPVKAVSPDCIGCLECVASCPKSGALDVAAAWPWQSWGALELERPRKVPVTIGPRPSQGEEQR